MFSAKAALATFSFGLGASAMAVAVYTQQPKAFTREVPAPPPAPQAAVTPTLALAVPEEEPMRPMERTVPVVPRSEPTLTTPAAEVETEILPCSGWQDMASGPDGRRVRYLCAMPPPDDGPRPGS